MILLNAMEGAAIYRRKSRGIRRFLLM